jgi:hypothetical protein
MRLLVSLLVWFLGAVVTSRGSLALENLALRQQLATYARLQQRPRLKPEERVFWVALSRIWEGWRSPLVLVKPATVIAWHRRGFQRYWRHKSGKPGRPRIPAEHIALATKPTGSLATLATPVGASMEWSDLLRMALTRSSLLQP